MIKNIKLSDRISCLENLVLIDANVILNSVLSEKYRRVSTSKEINIFRDSRKLIERLLNTSYKQVMCYTSLIWREAHIISERDKRFSREKFRDLKTNMAKTKKNVYQICLNRIIINGISNDIFTELVRKLNDQHVTPDLNDLSLIYSCLILGIPTIITYDEHFFNIQMLISNTFATEELKRRERYPDHNINNYSVMKPEGHPVNW